MAKVKFASLSVDSVGAIVAESGVVDPTLNLDAAYLEFDPTGIGYARFGAKRNGAGTSAGAKISTLNAGTFVDAVTYAANGAATFALGIQVASGGGVSALQALTATTGAFSDPTDATSSTAASVTMAGGLAVAKKLYVGSDLHVAGAFAISALTATTGAFSDTTDASSSTAASVTLAGGLAVAKKLNVGSSATIAAGLTITANGLTVNSGTLSAQAVTATSVAVGGASGTGFTSGDMLLAGGKAIRASLSSTAYRMIMVDAVSGNIVIDPDATNNTTIGAAVSIVGAFGCNGATAQSKAASGGTLAGVISALVANGILSS